MKPYITRAYKAKKLKTDKNLPAHRLCKVMHCAHGSVFTYLNSNARLQLKLPWRRVGVVPLSLRPVIDEWIKARLKLRKNKRQFMKHYYNELCAAYPDEMAGVQCCVFTAYIKKKEQIFQSVHGYFLTLSHDPDECQADFGRFFYLDASGAERVGQIVALSFPYAGVSYAQVLPGKSAEGFLVCMQNIFRHVGGAPRELWLDNDAAYVSILYHGKKYERFLTPFFDSFCRHFEVKPVFMTAFQGHEKGSVENSVGYLRRNLLVPYPVITDFPAFNRELLTRSETLYDREHRRYGYNLLENFYESKTALTPLPAEFDCVSVQTKKPTKNGRLCLNGKSYYVPPTLAGTPLTATLSYDSVTIRDASGAPILAVPRCFGRTLQPNVDWSLILPTLAKNPHSLVTLPVVRTFPYAVRKYIATNYPFELKSFILNMTEVCRLSNPETAARVAEICVLSGKLKKRDFLRELEKLQ